jgi:hypothetical protein
MDGTGIFNSEAEAAAAEAEDQRQAYADEGVESPIGIGTDERRMHVRAYNYWVSLLNDRAYPSIEDLEPANLNDFAANSVLLDFTGGFENPTLTYLGSAIRAECDLPVELISAHEIPSRSLLSRLTDHYLQIIANRAPIGFEAEFINHRGNNTMYRGILMPFSSDDDTIDFIYGVINWKEVADADTTSAIVDEVERALQATPLRKIEPVPVWADGPGTISEEPRMTPRADVLGTYDDLGHIDAVSAYPTDDDGFAEDSDDNFSPDGSETLGDWLAAARASAETAHEADCRSRVALYRALSRAYDFALEAEANPEDYAELLVDCGITVQERAPMTPIVKLVFGADHDKTRLAEYALVLSHARHAELTRGALFAQLEATPGGLKAIIAAERSVRRPGAKATRAQIFVEKARQIMPKGIVELAGEEEFVVLFARRIDAGHVAVLGAVDHDDALMKKALRQIAG